MPGLTKLTAIRNESGSSAVKYDKYPNANGVAGYVTAADGAPVNFNSWATKSGLFGGTSDSINLCPEFVTKDAAGRVN